MEIALNRTLTTDLTGKIKSAIHNFKLSKLEDFLSNTLENLSDNDALNYIGELNKNDVML